MKCKGLVVTLGLLNITAVQYFLLIWIAGAGYSLVSEDITNTDNITENILESFNQRRLHIINICQENQVLNHTR